MNGGFKKKLILIYIYNYNYNNMNSYKLLNLNDNKELFNGISKNKTPLGAAKKFWRRFKYLDIIFNHRYCKLNKKNNI